MVTLLVISSFLCGFEFFPLSFPFSTFASVANIMHRFVTVTRKEKERPIQQLLPNPILSTNPAQISAVNDVVEIYLLDDTTSKSKKRGHYGHSTVVIT